MWSAYAAWEYSHISLVAAHQASLELASSNISRAADAHTVPQTLSGLPAVNSSPSASDTWSCSKVHPTSSFCSLSQVRNCCSSSLTPPADALFRCGAGFGVPTGSFEVGLIGSPESAQPFSGCSSGRRQINGRVFSCNVNAFAVKCEPYHIDFKYFFRLQGPIWKTQR